MTDKIQQALQVLKSTRDKSFGTQVTNCIIHANRYFTSRPEDCRLCQVDIRNHLEHLYRVNQFLNIVISEATELLEDSCLLDLKAH